MNNHKRTYRWMSSSERALMREIGGRNYRHVCRLEVETPSEEELKALPAMNADVVEAEPVLAQE